MRMVEDQLRPKIFTWENVPNIDSESQNLRNYLKDNFMLKGIEQLGITKSDDEKTIYLSDGKESGRISVDLSRGQTKASLRINDRPVYEFLVQKERDRLVIRENDILTVWFNAWRYQSEDDFALIPLMKTIAYAMGEHPLYKEIKPVILRGLAIIGKDLLRSQASRFMTEKGIQEFEDNITRRIQNSVEFDKEVIYFDGIKKIEDEMLTILKNYPDTRIVIFIDDLDRCSPDKALEVFESIKVFLDLRGIVFVLGLSREALDKLIVAKYEQLGLKGISGEQYIRKIIQIEIQISRWKDTSIRGLIKKLSADLDETYAKEVSNNEELIQMVVEYNPRQAKRFINNFIVALTANKRLDSTKFLLIEALHKRWKLLYDNLSDARFLKEIKRGMEMSEEKREAYMKKVEEKIAADVKAGYTPDRLDTTMRDFSSYFLGDDLWKFLSKFGGPIFEKVSSEGDEPTEEETSIAKDLESYKQARESSNIPIPPTKTDEPKIGIPNNEINYTLSYYNDLIKNVEDSIRLLQQLDAKGLRSIEDEALPTMDIQRMLEPLKNDTEPWLILYTRKRQPEPVSTWGARGEPKPTTPTVSDQEATVKDLCRKILATIDTITDTITSSEKQPAFWFKANIEKIKRILFEIASIASSAIDEIKASYPGAWERSQPKKAPPEAP